jgi:hypothetical protein
VKKLRSRFLTVAALSQGNQGPTSRQGVSMIPVSHSRATSAHHQADHPENRPATPPSPVTGPDRVRDLDGQGCLFEAFITCRTTLDDLAIRLAVHGKNLGVATIAAHLTGRTRLGEPDHNVIANAINARLAELARPARTLPYR